MRKQHINLFFPQWQGAGRSKELLWGAMELKERFLGNESLYEIVVSNGENESIENNILGYTTIIHQLEAGKALIQKEIPQTIFSVGGGCDIEIMPVSYLNKLLEGDLTVLWLDAHGDLNTPDSSPSKNFHGMPLRVLLGDGDNKIVKQAFSRLLPEQLVLLGTRDLDEPESQYIAAESISVFTADEIIADMDKVLDIIAAKGSGNIYIHIDLDVLDMEQFPCVMCPTCDGLDMETLMKLLNLLKERFDIAGMSVLEYTPSKDKAIELLEGIFRIGTGLGA